ncbi:DUF4304 domain-containing protein [Hyphomicrobium sp. 2TAF46]|uniref:DUF4304 domain-containing protein n=1 Tax=Hyphomicrobium sp. 2TAF46 TaxID=3233019 RepID=UPI003F902F52
MSHRPGHLMEYYGVDPRSLPPPTHLPPPSSDVRAPREVYEEVCLDFAARFKGEGFRYFKSKKSISKTQGDLTFVLKFDTSRWNIRGINVRFSPSVEIYSSVLADWRRQRRIFDGHGPFNAAIWSGLACGGLNNILTETVGRTYPVSCSWNVAYIETRGRIVDDIEAFIREYVLPYFEFFLDRKNVLEALIVGDKDCRGLTSIPGLDITEAIEYALCFGTLEQASAILHRRKKLLSNLTGTEVEQRFQTFRQKGLSRQVLNGPGFADEISEIRRYWQV